VGDGRESISWGVFRTPTSHLDVHHRSRGVTFSWRSASLPQPLADSVGPDIRSLSVRKNFKPWGIAGVNIFGSFLLGAVTVSSALSPTMKLMLGTGFCGAYTTFSTYSVDVVGGLVHWTPLGTHECPETSA
jgi:hypothetical protein